MVLSLLSSSSTSNEIEIDDYLIFLLKISPLVLILSLTYEGAWNLLKVTAVPRCGWFSNRPLGLVVFGELALIIGGGNYAYITVEGSDALTFGEPN